MKKIFTLLTALLTLMAWPLTASADEVTSTFDFENNPNNWPVGEGANFADGNLTDPLVVGEVTLTNVQGDAKQPARIMRANDGISALYVYKDGSIRFNAADGRALIKIEVTMKSGSFDLKASTGAVADDVWTGNATEVLFTSTATRQMKQIVVTTDAKNGETVEPAAETFDVEATDIAAFNAAEDGKVVKLTLSNARVNGKFNDYYVEDASGATVVKGITLTPGTVLNGYVVGTKGTDNTIDYMNDPAVAVEYQLTATDATTFEATETTLTGTVLSITDACAQANYGRLVTIEDVTITGGGQNKTLTDANGNTMKARDYMGVLPTDFTWPEKAAKITGVVVYYMTGWFLMPISAEAIEEPGQQPSSVTFDFVNNNMGLPIGTAEAPNAGNLGGKTVTIDGVTLKFVNALTMPTRYYLNGTRGNQLQVLAGGQMRVTAPEGYAVTGIVSTGNPATNQSTGAISYQNNWEVVKGGGSLTAANQETQTWTGNAESVLLNAKSANYANALLVTLAAVNGETALLANEEADSYTDVDGLQAFAEADNNSLVKLKLTDAVVTSGMVNGWGCYIQDANAGANIYCTGLELEVGDVLNGVVYVKKSNQNMGPRLCMTEATNADGLTITKGGSYTPVEGTVTEINVAANKCRVVKLTGVAVKGTSETAATVTDAEGQTIVLNNGKTNYFPYVIQESLANIDYAKATVVGIFFGNNATTNQIMPLSITEQSTDGIEKMENGKWNIENGVYDLQGRRVERSKVKKGLYIVNGKKVTF